MAKKRASGEGSIRKRKDGRWEGRYIAGHDENGKPIRKNVLGKTQAEVRDKLKQAIELSQRLDVARAGSYTVETWLNTWYELYAKPNIRETTQRSYRGIIDLHIVPYIGDIMLTKLTTRDIQRLYNELRDNGSKRPETKNKNPGLSASYVRGVHRVLHNCLKRAVKEKLIPSNPSDDCIIPKLEKKEMKILRPEDMTAYLKEADRRGVLPLFFLELCTGLRKGELVALLWEDLDQEKKTIRVCKQAIGVKGGGVKVSRPKTETSIRTISVSQEAIKLLVKEHEKHPENPYMFPSPVTGGMYYPDAITRLHDKILKSAGIEHIRLHDLRHTFATTALQNGVDIKTVSGMLGRVKKAWNGSHWHPANAQRFHAFFPFPIKPTSLGLDGSLFRASRSAPTPTRRSACRNRRRLRWEASWHSIYRVLDNPEKRSSLGKRKVRLSRLSI